MQALHVTFVVGCQWYTFSVALWLYSCMLLQFEQASAWPQPGFSTYASSSNLQGVRFSHAFSTSTTSCVVLQFIETSTGPAYELGASLCPFPYSTTWEGSGCPSLCLPPPWPAGARHLWPITHLHMVRHAHCVQPLDCECKPAVPQIHGQCCGCMLHEQCCGDAWAMLWWCMSNVVVMHEQCWRWLHDA